MTIDALIIQCYKTVVFFMNYNILLSSCEYPVLVIFWELGGCHYTLIDVLLMKWVALGIQNVLGLFSYIATNFDIRN